MQEYACLLGNAVKKARLDMKLTQLEVADRIYADERTLLNIEHNKGNPKLEILWPLLRTLGIDANDVFYPERATESGAALHLQLLLSPICESIIDSYGVIWHYGQPLTFRLAWMHLYAVISASGSPALVR